MEKCNMENMLGWKIWKWESVKYRNVGSEIWKIYDGEKLGNLKNDTKVIL
jgi:hypothetical protein